MDALRPLFQLENLDRARGKAMPARPFTGVPLTRLDVDAIVFDTADVLFDATYWPRKLARLVNRMGVSARYQEFIARWERDFLPEVCRGRREYEEALQSFLLTWGLSWANIDEIEADGRIQRRHAEHEVRTFPGVARTLRALALRGYRLAAWADSCEPAANVAAQLDRLGLSGVFGSILCSADLEVSQPDPQCYQACIAALGVAGERMGYVGHDADHLAAAKAAGLVTVAYNHPPAATADYYLPQFDTLLSLLATPLASAARP
jgi:putative hydrolase of the HAD superfamily